MIAPKIAAMMREEIVLPSPLRKTRPGEKLAISLTRTSIPESSDEAPSRASASRA
jgi:hypothetical protein